LGLFNRFFDRFVRFYEKFQLMKRRAWYLFISDFLTQSEIFNTNEFLFTMRLQVVVAEK